MNPDAALRALREAVRFWHESEFEGMPMTGFYANLIADFEALDTWMTRGGFPPAAWDHRPLKKDKDHG